MNQEPPSRPASARGPGKKVIAIFAIAIFAAGAGFCWKLFEFFQDLLAESGIGFAGVHLLVYALVASGFLALLGYSFLSGHFSNIEQPKIDLLEQERLHDRRDFAPRAEDG